MERSQESQYSVGASGRVHRKPVPKNDGTATPLLRKKVVNQKGPRGWPTSPRSASSSIPATIWSSIIDLVLFGFSVAFFAFTLIVNSYDRASTHDHPQAKERLLSAGKYGPTVFPILFAAVVGRAAHAFLVWRLERGARISTLDTLAGSTSLTSTITSQFRLRIISFLGVSLVAIWALSPIGGQASFRQLSIGAMTTTKPTSYNYMVSSSNLSGYIDSGRMAVWAIVNILYNAAIIGLPATKRSPRDIWGNVKVPRIEYYEGNHDEVPDEDGWFDPKLENSNQSVVFTSLAGVPLSGLEGSEFIDHKMNLQTMYLNVTCSKGSFDTIELPINVSSVHSERGNSASIWWEDTIFNSTRTSSTRSNMVYDDRPIAALRFGYMNSIGMSLQADCLLRTTYVEVEVSCPDAASCLVSKIRRSRLNHPQLNATQLDVETAPYWNWLTFATAFVGATTSRSAYPTLVDYFVAWPDNPLEIPTGIDIAQSAMAYTVGLGQLINTYWTCTTAPYALSVGLTNRSSYVDQNITFALVSPDQSHNGKRGTNFFSGPSARLWQTQGTRSRRIQVIQAHRGWIVALSIASAVLIIASLVSPIVRHFLITGPEIVMNISSLATRNNPYILLPPSGTYLNASDRAGLLKDYMVRLGDVNTGSDVGSLAIGTVNDGSGVTVARGSKGRVYE